MHGKSNARANDLVQIALKPVKAIARTHHATAKSMYDKGLFVAH